MASDVAEFQKKFGLDFEDEPLSDDFCGVLLSLSEKMKSDPFNAVFYTVFLLIPKNCTIAMTMRSHNAHSHTKASR